MGRATDTEESHSIRNTLREEVAERLCDMRQVEDEELYQVIDEVIMAAGERLYLPLKEKIHLRISLFDSFRRLDILQELVDNPDITEIMVNGKGCIFVEKNGRMLPWEKSFDSVEQLPGEPQGKCILPYSRSQAGGRFQSTCSFAACSHRRTCCDNQKVSRTYYHETVNRAGGHYRGGGCLFKASGGSRIQYFYQRRNRLRENHIS